MSDDEELGAWLGLASDERLVCAASSERPPSTVAEGRSTDFEQASIEALVEAVRVQPHLSPAAGGDAQVRARFWDLDPGVVVVEAAHAARARGAAAALGDGAWVLDGRARDAWLVTEDAQGTVVLQVGTSGVRWMRVVRNATADEVSEPGASAQSARIDAWLGDESAQPWLVEEAARLVASGHGLAPFAAAGLVARLWSPPPGEARRAALVRRLAGSDGPAARVRRWARGLARVALRSIERDALGEAADCARAIAALSVSSSERDLEGERELLAGVARRRDDLESVAFVLRAAGWGEAIDRALAALDDIAATRLSTMMAIGLVEADERLAAVAWQEPLAWWGAIANP